MLQSLRSTYPDLCLLVPGILCKLLHEHKSHEDSASLSADIHLICWSYDDSQLGEGSGREAEERGRRSIAFDGTFAYVSSSSLNRLLKIGTGRHGTIRLEWWLEVYVHDIHLGLFPSPSSLSFSTRFIHYSFVFQLSFFPSNFPYVLYVITTFAIPLFCRVSLHLSP